MKADGLSTDGRVEIWGSRGSARFRYSGARLKDTLLPILANKLAEFGDDLVGGCECFVVAVGWK
jgi:hypothetical protein